MKRAVLAGERLLYIGNHPDDVRHNLGATVGSVHTVQENHTFDKNSISTQGPTHMGGNDHKVWFKEYFISLPDEIDRKASS